MAIIVKPSHKPGRWIPGPEIANSYLRDIYPYIQYAYWQCSNCNCISEDYRKPTWNYCPHCGADMKEVRE